MALTQTQQYLLDILVRSVNAVSSLAVMSMQVGRPQPSPHKKMLKKFMM